MSRNPTSRRWAPFVEAGVLAVLLGLANWLGWPGDPGFASLSPHPTLFLALIVLARYGLVAGAVAGGLLAGEHLLLVALLGHGLAHPSLWSPQLTAPLILLVPTTVLLGMLVQRHIDRSRNAELAAREAGERLLSISAEVARLRSLNVQLGEKIVHADSSVGVLLDQLKALTTLDRDMLSAAVLRLMAELLHVEAASVWQLDSRGLRLRAWEGERPPTPFEVDESLEAKFDGDGILAVREVPLARRPGLPLLVGKIRAGAGGPLVGYLAIDKLPLARSAEAARLFSLIVGWMSVATGNALAYEQRAGDPKRLKKVAQ